MPRYIEVNALMNYANNQKDKTIDANDIARFPWADVVEVVRCKECKHSAWDALGKCYWCKGKERTADFFCADGERREVNDEG